MTKRIKAVKSNYENYWPFDAEGARIGVRTCKRCGAAVLLGGGETATDIHDKWHEIAPLPPKKK